ncbi:MAG: hypothetical protein GF398_13115 [Chitinivibrionales bacterium]|nr:hypothetical protein [Chitinivibrionales bacterium]
MPRKSRVGPGRGTEMNRPPRNPSEPIISPNHWRTIILFGILVGLPVLLGYAAALIVFKMELRTVTSITFLSVAFARLFHVFNLRESGSHVFTNHITQNRYVWGALALCTLLLLAAVYIAPVAGILDVVQLSLRDWVYVLIISLTPLILGQIGLKTGLIH